MNDKPARQTMTDGEREILYQIQRQQAKWMDDLQMTLLTREADHRKKIEELTKSMNELRDEIREIKQLLTRDRLF